MHLTNKLIKYITASFLVTPFCVTAVAAQQVSMNDTVALTAPVDTLLVSGVVQLASTGQPAGGISVSVPGFAAAISGDDGSFSIGVPDLQSVLLLTGEGFQDKQVALRGRRQVKVFIYDQSFPSQYESVKLDMGVVSKNFIPYSIGAVRTEDKWSQNIAQTPATYLQGKIAGLYILHRSGTPGIGADMKLNGINSLNATNQPLILVDGMPYDNNEYSASLLSGNTYNPLGNIDIRDIEDVTVLKSGNSTYGTRGANGVILITTARSRELATRIDFAAYGGFNYGHPKIPVLNAGDYRTLLSELLKTHGLTGDSVASLPYMIDRHSYEGYYNYHNETDWQDELADNSINNNFYLKVTGGDNIAKYALSLGYLTNKGVLKNSDLTRYQMRFNGDLNLSKRLTASVNLGLVSTQQNLLEQGGQSELSPLSIALIKAPFLSVHLRDELGAASPNLSGYDTMKVSNPVAIINNMQGKNKSYRFTGAVNFNYTLSDVFSIRTLFGVTFDKMQEDFFVPSAGIVPDTLATAIGINRSGSNMARFFSFYNNTALSYRKTFDNTHRLQVDLGYRFENSKFENEYGRSYNSATDEFVSVGMGSSALRTVGGANGSWNWLNTYLHADYSIHDRYFLSFNSSLDGSSRFGRQAPDGLSLGNVKFAFNPSLAAAWLISSEDFFGGVEFVDNLKLRASVSRVGNDDIGNYAARKYYIPQNLVGYEGLVRGNIGNPALQWETTDQMNLGLDVALLHERLSFSFDYFNNKSKNVITIDPTGNDVGIEHLISNNATMSNSGVELSVNTRVVNTQLKWDLGLNLATYTNKVNQFPSGSVLTDYYGATYITGAGMPVNQYFGYQTEGVFATTEAAQASGLQYVSTAGILTDFKAGDIQFTDLDGNHIIDENDRTVIGNPNPEWFGGLTNNFRWKRWGLNTLITFSQGADLYNYSRMQLESMTGFANQSGAVNNRWRYEGQQTGIPRPAWGDPSGNARFSDRWIEDGSFIRLSNVSLSYNIPVVTATLRYIDLYLTGTNLFVWTKYLGLDPEFSSTNSLYGQGVDLGLMPMYKTVQLGVRLGF